MTDLRPRTPDYRSTEQAYQRVLVFPEHSLDEIAPLTKTFLSQLNYGYLLTPWEGLLPGDTQAPYYRCAMLFSASMLDFFKSNVSSEEERKKLRNDYLEQFLALAIEREIPVAERLPLKLSLVQEKMLDQMIENDS